MKFAITVTTDENETIEDQDRCLELMDEAAGMLQEQLRDEIGLNGYTAEVSV